MILSPKRRRIWSAYLVWLMLFIMLFSISGAIAYAEDGEDQKNEAIESYYTAAGTIEQIDDDGSINTEANQARDVIIQYLKDNSDQLYGNTGDPTIQGGYKLIEGAIKAAGLQGQNVEVNWKKYFKENAQALGVQFNSLLLLGQTNAKSPNSSIEDSAKKINILTWDNSTDSQGHILERENQGVLKRIFEEFDDSGFVQNFLSPLCAISIAITIAFFCTNLMTMMTEKNCTDQAIQREFVKLIIGIWIIYNFRSIALFLIDAGAWVLSKLQLSITSSGAQGKSVEYALIKSFVTTLQSCNPFTNIHMGWMQGVGQSLADMGSELSGVFGDLTGSLGSGLIQLVSSLAIYSVVLELAARYVFTPIAIADLYSEKFRSSGVQWFKKLLALALTGAVMYMVVFVADVFKEALGATFSVITNMAINLTMLGMLFRARQIANDIVGTH